MQLRSKWALPDITLVCGLTSLHGFGPSCSPWPCPDIIGLCLVLGLLTGHDPEPHLWGHVLTCPLAIPVLRNAHDGAGRDPVLSGCPTPSWRDRMSPGCLTVPWQTPVEPPALPVLNLMEPSVSDVSWQCLWSTGWHKLYFLLEDSHKIIQCHDNSFVLKFVERAGEYYHLISKPQIPPNLSNRGLWDILT